MSPIRSYDIPRDGPSAERPPIKTSARAPERGECPECGGICAHVAGCSRSYRGAERRIGERRARCVPSLADNVGIRRKLEELAEILAADYGSFELNVDVRVGPEPSEWRHFRLISPSHLRR